MEVFVCNLDFILDLKLVDCDGYLYFVMCVWKGGQMESIDVWGQKLRVNVVGIVVDLFLDVDWEEVDCMLFVFFWQWSFSVGLFYYVGVGDFIYLICLVCGDMKFIIYSLQNCKWQFIDGCFVSYINIFFGGFEFWLCLDVVVQDVCFCGVILVGFMY